MRTTIDINKKLIKQVMDLSGAPSKKEAVQLSLQAYLRQNRIERLSKRLGQGQVNLTGQQLDKMRSR